MSRALTLAVAARRRTPPWPAVGCVIVRDGEVVGEGATGLFRRGTHAEVAALAAAGSRARGATAFVTLEPCDHHGNTPPCTEALIDAGIARVVVAIGDPDVKVRGRGFDRLRAAGVEVETGIGAAAVTEAMAAYLHHRRTGLPFVVVKIAQSLDGRVAAADGSSRWITGAAARADAHELRADSQAIVVGSETARLDRPSLTVRDVDTPPARPPWRVVLDGRGRLDPSGPLFDTSLAPTLVVTTGRARPEAIDAWRAAGAKVEQVDTGRDGRGVDLGAVWRLLGAEGVLQALVEGGGTLAGAVVANAQAQRIVAYVAPTLLGTRGASGWLLDGPDTIEAAPRYDLVRVRQLGDDARLEYEVRS